MKRTALALTAGATVAGAALGLRAWMRSQTAAALPGPMPNLQLRVPGFAVLERITGSVDPAHALPLVLVLHGIGGDEAQLVPHTKIQVPARLVYVRGPIANGTAPNAGHSYFKARYGAAGFLAEVEAMAAQLLRVADIIASQRAVSRTLVLGYSQGGHLAWRLAATGRFDVVLPVSGALASGYQPPPPVRMTTIRAIHGEDDRTLPATAGAATFRAFGLAGYRVDFSRVKAGHSLTTLGKYIAPLLTAALDPQPPRVGLGAQVRAG